jgi:hypothetical protein
VNHLIITIRFNNFDRRQEYDSSEIDIAQNFSIGAANSCERNIAA